MKAVLLFGLFVFLSFSGHGMIVGDVKIEGTVIKYNKKTVTLKTSQGKRIKIPRRAVPRKFKLKTGAEVHAFLSPKVIIRRLSSTKNRHSKPKKGKKDNRRRK